MARIWRGSVTRFWKYPHFGKILDIFSKFFRGLSNIWQNFETTFAIFFIFVKFAWL